MLSRRIMSLACLVAAMTGSSLPRTWAAVDHMIGITPRMPFKDHGSGDGYGLSASKASFDSISHGPTGQMIIQPGGNLEIRLEKRTGSRPTFDFRLASGIGQKGHLSSRVVMDGTNLPSTDFVVDGVSNWKILTDRASSGSDEIIITIFNDGKTEIIFYSCNVTY